MYALQQIFEAIRDFVEQGGNVLFIIAFVIGALWMIMTERFIYFNSEHKRRVKETLAAWEARTDRTSWHAKRIREAMISRVSEGANQSLSLIKALVTMCPLLGLLGTVTGMIEVFDVMAVSGTGNARSMASGVAKAILPTMAGMVGALSGVFASTYLGGKAKMEIELLADHMADE
ncbi:MAG: MotA/TolQ/ExbB proton channel family protein [Gammaproteobacteria bacterium]